MKYLMILWLFMALPVFGRTKILFLGDSLTSGYGIAQENAYPYLIKKELEEKKKLDIKIYNGSVSGSTTSSGISRLEWYLRAKPNILILALGANDGLRGISIKKTQENLEKIILKALSENIKLVLVGMKLPPNYGDEYRDSFEKMFSDLNKKHKLVYLPFLLEGVATKKELNLPDGIHPNEKGHKIMKSTVLKYLVPLL